jgi:hypothetical protein
MVAVNYLQAAMEKAARFLAALTAVVAALYESARISVRMPLAVPLGLVGLILVLIVARCRRPPSNLFTRPDDAAQEETAPPAAIESPAVHAAAREAAPMWAFDEEL